jgi:hypothetical protein
MSELLIAPSSGQSNVDRGAQLFQRIYFWITPKAPSSAMGVSGVSTSHVSRLCAELEERVGKFLGRPFKGDRARCGGASIDRRTESAALSRTPWHDSSRSSQHEGV